MDDAYATIETEARAEIKVKGSRFIGESFLVETVDAALGALAAVRRREYQATHHCYAYLVGRPGNEEFKYSDDGEPSGTAGKPIYDILSGCGVTDTLVVVTRYFGGTKLGTGGLVRAYGEAARAVLDISGKRRRFLTREFRVGLEFSLYDQWRRRLHDLGATVTASDFSDRVVMQISIRQSRAEQLTAAFTELTSGKGEIEETTDS